MHKLRTRYAACSVLGLSFQASVLASVPCRSFIAEQRTTGHHSKTAYQHPLAPPDPAKRNIVVPDSVNRLSRRRGEHLEPDVIKKRAQKALLHHLQQEVLWEGTVLDEPNHELIQHFLKLHSNPSYRQARRMMITAGKEMIRELCDRGHAPKHLLVTAGKDIPEWASRLKNTDLVLVDRKIASMCAPGSDGYVGDFDIPPPPFKEVLIANQHRMNRVLVLDNVDDSGVLGTVLRSAVGFQYDAIIATNHCADLYDHRVVRAARGVHFQTGVPIYSLSDGDGDDVYGMLNHVIQRNDLLPVLFSPQEDDDNVVVGPHAHADANAHANAIKGGTTYTTASGSTFFVSNVVGAGSVPLPCSAAKTGIGTLRDKETLSDFCLYRFSGRADREDRGYMLIVGPNHTRNMLGRLSRLLVRRPTQLLLDSMPDSPDMLVSLSIVLHALRPNGHWNYLPVSEAVEPSSMELQTRRASVDIGPNRLVLDERSLNLDEEEQQQRANVRNEYTKWRRLRKRQKNDYDMWMDAETSRVKNLLHNEREKPVNPFDMRRHRRVSGTGATGMPSWVPNILDEYRMPFDRDRLREERDKAETFTRPSNYATKEFKKGHSSKD